MICASVTAVRSSLRVVVDDLDVFAGADHLGDLIERHVAAALRVVELAVRVPLDDPVSAMSPSVDHDSPRQTRGARCYDVDGRARRSRPPARGAAGARHAPGGAARERSPALTVEEAAGRARRAGPARPRRRALRPWRCSPFNAVLDCSSSATSATAELYAEARRRGDEPLSRLLLSAQPPPPRRAAAAPIPGQPSITLGERKSLARGTACRASCSTACCATPTRRCSRSCSPTRASPSPTWCAWPRAARPTPRRSGSSSARALHRPLRGQARAGVQPVHAERPGGAAGAAADPDGSEGRLAERCDGERSPVRLWRRESWARPLRLS